MSMMDRLRSLTAPSLATLLWLGAACLPAVAQYNGPPTDSDHSNVTTVTSDPQLLFPSTPETVLAAGDLISVRLFSDSDYNVSARVAIDGDVLMPLIGPVHLAGLSVGRRRRPLRPGCKVQGCMSIRRCCCRSQKGRLR